MRFGLTDEQIKTINDIFSKYNEIVEVIIFGSRVDGANNSGSDIDFAIKTNVLKFVKLGRLITDFIESNLPFFVDIVDYNTLNSDKLKLHIDSFGIVFFSKEEK